MPDGRCPYRSGTWGRSTKTRCRARIEYAPTTFGFAASICLHDSIAIGISDRSLGVVVSVRFSMKRMRVRLWLVALVCVACGVTSRLVFAALAPPNSRAQEWGQWEFQVFWYATALLLFLAHMWFLGTSGRPSKEVPGCGVAVLWVVGAVLAFLALVSFSRPID